MYLPFQSYPGEIRGAQGYLTKLPLDFVNRWPQLASAAERLSSTSYLISDSVDFNNPEFSKNGEINFRPKNDSDYVAFIKGGTQQRSRSHETLVRRVGEYLRTKGAIVTTPHPIDLLMLKPFSVVFEMKIVGLKSPGLLIREAVGQLFEYKYFEDLRDSFGCIVLELDPGPPLVRYVEDFLKIGIAWFISDELHCGPKTAQVLTFSELKQASSKS